MVVAPPRFRQTAAMVARTTWLTRALTRLATAVPLLTLALLGPSVAHAVTVQQAEKSTSPPSKVRTDRQHLRLPVALCDQRLVAVHLQGLQRTHRRVVARELLFRVGAPLSCAAVRESVQRLRNLGLFRRVDVALARVPGDDRAVALTLSVDEKWTLLPIFSTGRGGGRLYLLAGAQDVNLAGRALQLQAYWYLLAGTHSAVMSLADPRLAHTRVRLEGAVEHGNRNRYLYGSNAAPTAAWSRHRERLTLALSDLRQPQRTWGLTVHGLWDRFSTRLLTPQFQRPSGNALLSATDGLPADGLWLLPSLWVRLGRIDRDDYLEQRGYVSAAVSLGAPLTAAIRGSAWTRLTLSGKWAWIGPSRLHLARLNLIGHVRLGTQRSLSGDPAAVHPEHRFYVGGLSAVRGYWEGRFVGEHMAVANLEARLPSWHGRTVVLQHVVFVDTGWVLAGPLSRAGWRGGGSVGAGLRIILPLIAHFVARLDVAWAVADGDWRVSFGSQQFF